MPSTTDPHSQQPAEPDSTQNDQITSGQILSLSSAVSAAGDDLEHAPFWKEVAAFNQLPQPMIDDYYGQYVAVYQGNIVDSDPDEAELALRFYRTFGYVPVYIHKVGTEDGLIDTEEL